MGFGRRLGRVLGAGALLAVFASGLANCAEDYGSAPTETPDGSVSPGPDGQGQGQDQDGSNPSDGGSNGDADCPGTGGPKAIRVGTLIGNEFCVDTTEVTRAQYVDFLSSDPQPRHPRCLQKTSFVPRNNWPPLAGEGQLPVVWVDWCDAYTFCEWAGKRLCGNVNGGGLDGGPERFNARINQFLHACTGGGAHEYAYGNDYVEGRCNGPDAAAPEPVGSRPTCQGGFDGLFDMSGNVSELQDNCDPGELDGDGGDDACYATSGSFIEANGFTPHRCVSEGEMKRSGAYRNLGFRCCGP